MKFGEGNGRDLLGFGRLRRSSSVEGRVLNFWQRRRKGIAGLLMLTQALSGFAKSCGRRDEDAGFIRATMGLGASC